ncbi:hypothetical protein PoB_003696000 [Plakobranchus ocellatus]|uniref:Uncharacterized protein n=1 Tax=Plakobranchus ocellatus TaxID=259542 RepID=A0AAV4AU66_9GAST|nr:hypothetical protein PoB_003696000 [Plakobranchus ocellatus]
MLQERLMAGERVGFCASMWEVSRVEKTCELRQRPFSLIIRQSSSMNVTYRHGIPRREYQKILPLAKLRVSRKPPSSVISWNLQRK